MQLQHTQSARVMQPYSSQISLRPDKPEQQDRCLSCNTRSVCLGLDIQGKAALADGGRRKGRVFHRNETILREGDEHAFFHIVRSGSVKSYLTTDDGEEQVLRFHLPGDVLGLDGSHTRRRLSSAITLETTSVCSFPLSQLLELKKHRGLLELFSQQMADDHNLLLMLAKKNADGRLASFLWDFSRRFERRGYSSSTFMLSMTRRDIGNYLGLAVETVSRTLKGFQESGFLGIHGREVVIHDMDMLQAVAGAQAPH